MAKTKHKKVLSTQELKLAELKKEVYQLAEVKTTKKLKALRSEFASLDFRRKASWQAALNALKREESFEQWRSNPPEKYKEIFKEIDEASKEHKTNLENTKKAFQNLEDSIEELDQLTKDTKEEAGGLTQEKIVTIPVSLPEKNPNQPN